MCNFIKKSDEKQDILTINKYGFLYLMQIIAGLSSIVSFGYYVSFIIDFTSQLATCAFAYNPT